MSKIEEFVKTLHVIKEAEVVENTETKIVYDLKNSDNFLKMYTNLTELDLDLDGENVVMNEDEMIFNYLNDDYDVNLEADYEKDKYILEIKLGEN